MPNWKPEKKAKKPRKGLNPVNAKRKARLTLRNFGTEKFREFTKMQPCLVCGAAPRQWWNRDHWGNDMAHTDARGMGGCGGDWTKVIPACPECHDGGLVEGRTDLAEQHQERWLVYSQGEI